MKMLIKRAYSGLVDILFVGIIVYILYMFYFYNGMKTGDFTINLEWLTVEYKIVYMVAMFVYYAIGEMFNFSVGKKLFKISIDYGTHPKLAKFLRPFFKLILLNIPFLFIISIFPESHRIFYDYILKTDVTNEKYERSDLR